ncbi:TOM1-like protein 2 [Clonorchis sinensis]|uniref:TOM1-like protein 2 n=2 Tax=Clonorchis sinensis TaxID=79923 RepID=A0A8T1MQB9_CLOSI|nr:TOM1-like protein 2 [Clonorchis sinensis]
MHNLFNPHPFSTPVGILTERATDSGQSAEDWSLILEICDTINETDEGPKEAIRAIRKRLSSSAGRDHTSVWYTLLLLDACIQNCGRRFHSQVANKEFLHDFLKLLSPKNEPSQQLQNQVLYMLKSWVELNWDVPGKRDMEKIYTTLRQKGIQFPQSPANEIFLNSVLPRSKRSVGLKRQTREPPPNAQQRSSTVSTIKASPRQVSVVPHPLTATVNNISPCTVCRAHPNRESLQSSQGVSSSNLPNQFYAVPIASQAAVNCGNRTGLSEVFINTQPGTVRIIQQTDHRFVPKMDAMELDADGTVRHLTSTQRVKLTQDLSVVETNVNVLNDMLAELRPDSVSQDDLVLLQELVQTCRAMHRRVIEFLSQVSDDEVTPSLLQVSDNLNSAFLRYDRFERYRQRAVQLRAGGMRSSSLAALPAAHTRRQQPAAITGGQLLAIADSDPCASTTNGLQLSIPAVNGQVRRNNVNDDDDDLLIDVSEGLGGAETTQPAIDCDEVAQWLAVRQLVPVSGDSGDSSRSGPAMLALQQGIHSMSLSPTTRTIQTSPSTARTLSQPVPPHPTSLGAPDQPPCNSRRTAPNHSSTDNLLFF